MAAKACFVTRTISRDFGNKFVTSSGEEAARGGPAEGMCWKARVESGCEREWLSQTELALFSWQVIPIGKMKPFLV